MATKKKVHWTKLPKNKARVAAMTKKMHQRRKQLNRDQQKAIRHGINYGMSPERIEKVVSAASIKEINNASVQAQTQEHIAYIYGRVEVEIEHYSRSVNVPFSVIAEGVATLLQHSKGR